MTLPVGAVTTVPVKSAMTSKINITQLVGVAAMLASYFGLPFTPDQLAAVVTVIGTVQGLVTWVMKTWFSNSVVSSST